MYYASDCLTAVNARRLLAHTTSTGAVFRAELREIRAIAVLRLRTGRVKRAHAIRIV